MRSKKTYALGLLGGLSIVKRAGLSEISDLILSLHPLDSGVELIRLGPDGDGGYLIPDDLEGIEYAFSPGVSTESGFEEDLARRGLRIFLADFAVDEPAEANPHFVFDKQFVGCVSDDTFTTMDEWKNSKLPGYTDDLILQMDIEGAEFEALLSTSADLLSQFRIMVIEFHFLHQLFNKPYFDLSSQVFKKLLQTHSVVHIHPNNCCGSVRAKRIEVPRVAEFTFYRNDRLRQHAYCGTFPHALDRDNTAKPTLILPECWYN